MSTPSNDVGNSERYIKALLFVAIVILFVGTSILVLLIVDNVIIYQLVKDLSPKLDVVFVDIGDKLVIVEQMFRNISDIFVTSVDVLRSIDSKL